ncbi:MAG TPA: ATP-grasp domain-containing protein [Polyangiales bacterium]
MSANGELELGAMQGFDPTSRLIIEEARLRGIAVDILAPRAEYFRLSYRGRSICCRESLSELTSAVAMSICDDKRATQRVLTRAGLRTPVHRVAGTEADNVAFLEQYHAAVVKPARGEQGKGISVGVRSAEQLLAAIEHARTVDETVLLEEFVEGDDLRLLVMDGKLVAAAVRRPPRVTGNGELRIAELIVMQSRKRAAETSGEGRIPLDEETRRCVREAGYELDDILPRGVEIEVRRAANVHTGGTIHDVTEQVSHELAEAACCAARALAIPIVGLDLIVPSLTGEQYWILEANERPGLANHEPQPTAARFVDTLFPETKRRRNA